MKSKKTLPKERNPFVQHLLKKHSGAHQKSKKAIRTQEKSKLKKEYFQINKHAA